MRLMLEQERAKYALNALNKLLEDKNKKNNDKYATYIRRLPSMILTNGLGQALAFLLADNAKDTHSPAIKIYHQIQHWLLSERKIYDSSDSDLMATLVKQKSSGYMHAQHETLKLLVWMKKFADAYLPESGGNSNGKAK